MKHFWKNSWENRPENGKNPALNRQKSASSGWRVANAGPAKIARRIRQIDDNSEQMMRQRAIAAAFHSHFTRT